jgi:uncharacterized membrane protein YjfL (UPF0719 family)
MTGGATQVYLFNILYAIGGIIIGLLCAWLVYWFFDKITPTCNFDEELKKGNIAVAIAIGCLFIMIGLLVGLIVGLGLN